MTGIEFDRALRAGAAQGHVSLPPFGRLLAATQSGGPMTMNVDTTNIAGPIIGVLSCEQEEAGVTVSVKRGKTSLLWFRTDGCIPGNVYSGMSQDIGNASGQATLRLSTPRKGSFAFVLEEVART